MSDERPPVTIDARVKWFLRVAVVVILLGAFVDAKQGHILSSVASTCLGLGLGIDVGGRSSVFSRAGLAKAILLAAASGLMLANIFRH